MAERDALNVGYHARLEILLCPVGAIKRKHFERYAQQVRSRSVVALRDIPPDSRGDRAVLSSSPRASGHVLLSFVDTHPRYNAFLEDFEPCRRLFGVIGIADCAEVQSLEQTGREFQQILRHYPGIASSRCYAFNPKDGQQDNVEGIVTIPSVGDPAFYISTLVADFASTLLYELSNAVASLEARTVFQTPVEAETPGSPFNMVPASPHGNATSTIGSYAVPSSRSNPELSGVARTTSKPNGTTPTAQVDMLSPTINLSPPKQSRMATSLGGGTSPGNQEGVLHGQNINSQFRLSTASPSLESPTATSDKASKRRMQGRAGKLRGDLYVLAGRWAVGLNHYNDALALAKSVGDPLWEAAIIERQLLTTILIAWQPHIPDPLAEHATPRVDLTSLGNRPVSQEAAAQTLSAAKEVPERYRALLEQYARLLLGSAAPGSTDALPMSLMAEAALRCAHIQLVLLRHNSWSSVAMSDMIESTHSLASKDLKRLSASSENAVGVNKSSISDAISYAYLPSMSNLPIPQRLGFLGHIAALYGTLGFLRKRAVVLREIAAIAGDSIRQAKNQSRAGGAILTTEEDSDGNDSIIEMLLQVADAYGSKVLARVHVGGKGGKRASVIAGPTAAAASDNEENRFGWPDLQVAVMRDAIRTSELISHYRAALRFSVSTLREVATFMPPMDQLALSQTIPTIFAHLARRGNSFALDYWGPNNLLVSLEPVPLSSDRQPVEHSGSIAEAGSTGPFIYSAKSSKRASTTTLSLVQSEAVDFVVTLQNPFLFDLEIPSIELSTSGVSTSSASISARIPPSSFHTLRLSTTPVEAGQLIIRGCHVKLACAEAREFVLPLLTEVEVAAEKKRQSLELLHERIKGGGLALWRASATLEGQAPVPTRFLEGKVVPQQPLLRLKASSLTNGALMLYDGERTSIQLVLKNISTLPVNSVKLTFTDSYTASVQAELRNTELPAGEAYELDLSMRQTPTFAWPAHDQPLVIRPGAQAVLTVLVFGKLGCKDGNITVDYAHLAEEGQSSANLYGRQLQVDVLMTVHRALEAFTMSIQRLQAPLAAEPARERPALDTALQHAAIDPALEASFRAADEDKHCLLAVDVRNVYGQPFEVAIERRSEDARKAIVRQRIEPGATSTILLRLDRLRIAAADAAAPLPSLAGRQFVVAKTASNAVEESQMRQLFWYREAFLQSLQATWREIGSFRQGDISLRSLRLSRPALDVLKIDDISINLSVEANTVDDDAGLKQFPTERPAFKVRANTFVDIVARIANATEETLDVLTRFDTLPGIGRPPELTQEEDLDELSRFVVFDGVPWTSERGFAPGQTIEARIPALFLAAGRFEIGCSVEARGQLFVGRKPLAIEVYL